MICNYNLNIKDGKYSRRDNLLQDTLGIGDKIDIISLDQEGNEIKHASTHYSQLLDIIDENIISIAVPSSNGTSRMLHQGILYQLCFYTSKGLYTCKGTMLKTYKENNIMIFQVEILSELTKIQRRQYYRLECILEFEYRLVTPEEIKLQYKLWNDKDDNEEIKNKIRNHLEELDKHWNKASITDLSGGGAKFTSKCLHNMGDTIRIRLILPKQGKEKELVIEGQIVVSQKIINVIDKFETRVQFSKIDRLAREEIIRFIFEQERQKIKNVK